MTTETDWVGVILGYDNKGTSVTKADIAGKYVQDRLITTSAAVANAWTNIGTLTGLTPNKHYAIVGYRGYGANAIALKFSHSAFGGCTPGGPIGVATLFDRNEFNFTDFDMCPVFESNEALLIWHLNSSTDTIKLWVKVVQLD